MRHEHETTPPDRHLSVDGSSQPGADEQEGAHILANEARDELRSMGLDDEEIQELADRFVAEEAGVATDAFVEWVRRQRG